MTTTQTLPSGLSPYHYKGTAGLLGRYYAADGTTRQQLFCYGRYGGDPDATQRAACAWLRAQALTTPIRRRHRVQPTARTRTGQVGVCLTYATSRSGTRHWLYSVSFTLGGRRRTKTFRLHHYPTQEAAFAAACAFRQAMTRQMHAERQQAAIRRWTEAA